MRSAPTGIGRFAVAGGLTQFCLEADLTVGRLPATLPLAVLFFLQQVDGRRGYRFVDVPAAQACAVLAVPVALGDHRATTPGAVSGQGNASHAQFSSITYYARAKPFGCLRG